MNEFEINLSLSAEERNTLGVDLLAKIRSAREGMFNMLTDIGTWDKLYEGKLPPKTFPWEGCSNLNVPVTQWIIDTWQSHVNDVIMGVSPHTLVQAPTEMSDQQPAKDVAKNIESLLQDVETHQMDLAAALGDELIPAALRWTAGIGKVAWREDYRIARTVVEGQVQENKAPKRVGPRLEFVDLRNFVIYPLTAKSVEDAVMVGDRFRLTPQAIRKNVKDKFFLDSATELADRATTEAGHTDDMDADQTNEYIGIERSPFFQEVWFWEVIAQYDADGDGIPEDCMFTLDADTGVIVRATKYPYHHGRRCYVPFRVHPRPGYFFGRSLCGILEGCQKEINAIHNQRIDSVTLAMTTAFKALKGSSIQPDSVIVSPGNVIMVDSMSDIEEFKLNPIVPGLDAESMARDYLERVSAVNDISLGRTTEKSKTLGEVAMANSEGGIRFGDVIRRLQASVVEVGRQVLGLLYQFADDQFLAQYQIQRDDLLIEWDLIPHGNTGTANKMQQRQESMLLYDKFLGGAGTPPNPLVSGDPTRVYQLSRDLLNAFDKRNITAYIGTDQEAQAIAQAQEQALQKQQAEQQAQQEIAKQQQAQQLAQQQQMPVDAQVVGQATQ